ncbi:MAG TPA: metallophosphoesterase [Solirubrobacteraceae bacterium]|nr:metallophosphoesterase [Solirubrobacteraceae bacterium]
MASERVNRILCAADPSGSAEAIDRLLVVADEQEVDAVVMLGDIGGHGVGYRGVFGALARARRPVYWVPGAQDVPVERYLQESFNIETAFPSLRGVHGTAAMASGGVLFAGLGGEISDDPRQPRDERDKLSYPRWEAEYRLKVLAEFDYSELVLLFWTSPAHKGLQRAGSEAVAELIGTYRPRLVVCGGEPGVEELGRSLVVAPGRLRDSRYAVADLHKRSADVLELARPLQ